MKPKEYETLLKPQEVKKILKVPVSKLAEWRRLGMPPSYYRFNQKVVRYSIHDLVDYLLDSKVTPARSAIIQVVKKEA